MVTLLGFVSGCQFLVVYLGGGFAGFWWVSFAVGFFCLAVGLMWLVGALFGGSVVGFVLADVWVALGVVLCSVCFASDFVVWCGVVLLLLRFGCLFVLCFGLS